MNELDLDKALELAKAASVKAMEHAVTTWNNRADLIVEEKNPRDFVTTADKECQQIIVDMVQELYPEHRFIGEEEGADNLGNPDSPYAWIIDPIDGTTPFIHGRDNFGNIIALQENGKTILGLINLPILGELYTATKGGSVLFNGNPISLRDTKGMHEAILCSNTVRRGVETDGVLMISSPKCGSLENYGSAVQEFSEMLKGCNDGCFFKGIRLWDVAAGCFMIEEAGGKSWYEFIEEGNVRGGLRVVSSTAPIFDELKGWVTTHF